MNLDMIDSTIVEIKTKLLLDCFLEIGRYLLANKGKASNLQNGQMTHFLG